MDKSYALAQLCPCILEVGLQRRDSWRSRARRIYDHELFYCFLGGYQLEIDGKSYILKEGDLAIIKPDTPHRLWVDEGQPGEMYYLHFDLDYRDDASWVYAYYNTPECYSTMFLGKLQHPEHIRPQAVIQQGYRFPDVISLRDSDGAEHILRSLYKAHSNKVSGLDLLSKSLMLKLLQMILSESGFFPKKEQEDLWVSQTIKQFITYNYFKKLSLDSIAAYTHLSPDYCGRVFKRETGHSIIDYLNEVRVNQAKRMLLDIDLSLADIAEMVGFSRENYFCLVAKKLTGMTPAQLRRYMLSITQPSMNDEEVS